MTTNTAHNDDPYLQAPFKTPAPEWRAPDLAAEPYGYPFRSCTYCGSIHPEDLLAFLDQGGVVLQASDWKYGWPHKFYVEGIANPQAGRQVRMGSESKRDAEGRTVFDEKGLAVQVPMMGEAPKVTHAKWYNVHLRDVSDDVLARLAAHIERQRGIRFARDERGIKWAVLDQVKARG